MQDYLKEGEALFEQGRTEEAEKLFAKLLKKDPESSQAYNNLAVIECQNGNLENAIEHLTRAIAIDPFNKDAIINYSALLKQVNRLPESLPVLEKVARQYPEDEELQTVLREALLSKASSTKIAVLCLPGLESFLRDIVHFLETKFRVQTCYSNNQQQIASAVEWADIVWLDWANEIAIFVTNQLPLSPEKRVICRIRSYEVLSGFLPRVNWSKVSSVLYVSDHIRKIAHEVYPPLANGPPSAVIRNGLNLQRFTFKERTHGFNIAVVGFINHKKNPSMWVEVLSRLVKDDPRYRLKVAGELQDLRYVYYFRNILDKLRLQDHVQFFGHVNEINKWFDREQINYLLSTSVFESFGYNIAEAMAMGIKPLIHNFPGAEDLWPHECLFSNIDELLQIVRNPQNYDSRKYRAFIEEKYPLSLQLEKIESVIMDLHQDRAFKDFARNAPDSELNLKQEDPIREVLPETVTIKHNSGAQVVLNFIPGDHISRFLIAQKFYEQEMLEYIYQHFKEGLNFIDVGGHIGNHAVFFGVVCKANRVDTFEPNLIVRQLMERNIYANQLTNVFIHKIALGASSGTGTLHLGPWPHTGMTKVQEGGSGDVLIKTLDSVIGGPVHILKIDVEGMAGDVLRGGRRVLEKNRPVLFVECANEGEYAEVLDVIEPMGYCPKKRFNATPTILFEYCPSGVGHSLDYSQAICLA